MPATTGACCSCLSPNVPAPQVIATRRIGGYDTHLGRQLEGLEGGFDELAAAVLESQLRLALVELRLSHVRGNCSGLGFAKSDDNGRDFRCPG
jgi:hypothetical protein